MENHFCYIDAENRTDIVYLKKYSNVTYYVFLGKNQEDKIKYENGTKVKKNKMRKTRKTILRLQTY